MRNKFLRRVFIIDAISGANSTVAVDAIGEIQRRRSRRVDERREKDNRSVPTNSLYGCKSAICILTDSTVTSTFSVVTFFLRVTFQVVPDVPAYSCPFGFAS